MAIEDIVSPDAERVVNEAGGSQSYIPGRFDLFDGAAMFEMARVMGEGAEKHGEQNWRMIPLDDHLNHLLMHVFAYLAGDRTDEHLSHIMCRAMMAQACEIQDLERNKIESEEEFEMPDEHLKKHVIVNPKRCPSVTVIDTMPYRCRENEGHTNPEEMHTARLSDGSIWAWGAEGQDYHLTHQVIRDGYGFEDDTELPLGQAPEFMCERMLKDYRGTERVCGKFESDPIHKGEGGAYSHEFKYPDFVLGADMAKANPAVDVYVKSEAIDKAMVGHVVIDETGEEETGG